MTFLQNRPALVGLIIAICAIEPKNSTYAQQRVEHPRAIIGTYDSEYPIPIPGKQAGKRDAAATAEIEAFQKAISLPLQASLDLQGIVKTGNEKNPVESLVSIAIDKPNRLRMDVQNTSGERSVRVSGKRAQSKSSNSQVRSLQEGAFGDPFLIPFELKSIASRPKAQVADDGIVLLGGLPLHRITVTLFDVALSGVALGTASSSTAASFYFNPETHLLLKSVSINQSANNRMLSYIQVFTYGDYRAVQSSIVPFQYSKTIDGQLVLSLNATQVAFTSLHEDSYFEF